MDKGVQAVPARGAHAGGGAEVAMQLEATLSALETMLEMWGPERTLPSAHELLEKGTRSTVLQRLGALQGEATQMRRAIERLRLEHSHARRAVLKEMPDALRAMCESRPSIARELARLVKESRGDATPAQEEGGTNNSG